ncbi:transaldolase [Niveibacterium microcysteis]|uniref:Transaldolase n=1 Tax=Niveibacterium microcysteis TaxID=2811415 RepID=A0ABX7MBT2_9RHOO|nr:transaldolase [Niveibacterium microcysteis]QSI78854.1 transaldolase [Niveibacterium microcysteis]
MSRLKAISALGQQVWLDSISRKLIESGELARLIAEDGISGVTSNPAIFQQALAKDPAYAAAKAALPATLTDAEARFEALALPDIQAACDAFLPLFDASHGNKGFVSFEVSPRLSRDAEGTFAAAQRLWNAIARPNVMIKIPATPEGLVAIRKSIAAGININVTLMFSPAHVEAVAQAHASGLADRVAAGLPVGQIRSVASVFISRVDSKIDPQVSDALKGKVAIASARAAYADWQAHWSATGDRFAALAAAGAHPQWLLWASTGTKNPAYSDVLYVETLIGPDTVNTVPEATLNAFRDHGHAAATLAQDPAEARATLKALAEAGVDINAVGEQLQNEGLVLFEQAFETLLGSVGA